MQPRIQGLPGFRLNGGATSCKPGLQPTDPGLQMGGFAQQPMMQQPLGLGSMPPWLKSSSLHPGQPSFHDAQIGAHMQLGGPQQYPPRVHDQGWGLAPQGYFQPQGGQAWSLPDAPTSLHGNPPVPSQLQGGLHLEVVFSSQVEGPFVPRPAFPMPSQLGQWPRANGKQPSPLIHTAFVTVQDCERYIDF